MACAQYANLHNFARVSLRNLNVLSVAAEAFPLIKTGGLADVVGALPKALAPENVTVRTLLPGYPAVMAAVRDAPVVHTFPNLHGGVARLFAASIDGADWFILDAPHLYARDGGPYSECERPRMGRQRVSLRRARARGGHDRPRRCCRIRSRRRACP